MNDINESIPSIENRENEDNSNVVSVHFQDISQSIDSIANLNSNSILTQEPETVSTMLRKDVKNGINASKISNTSKKLGNVSTSNHMNVMDLHTKMNMERMHRKELNEYLQTLNNDEANRAEISTIDINYPQNKILLKNFSSKECLQEKMKNILKFTNR